MTDLNGDSLDREGFCGFIPLSTLQRNHVPVDPGVYVVLWTGHTPPEFANTNPGGRFKGRDPSVVTSVLRAKWVADAAVIYIGKAISLRKRLGQFQRFGAGHAVGHWGGRYVWQLSDAAELIVAWQSIPVGADPRLPEIDLLERFRARYGSLPYANINS